MSASHVELCRLAIRYAKQNAKGDLRSNLEMFQVYVEDTEDIPQNLVDLLKKISNGTADAETERKFCRDASDFAIKSVSSKI